MNDKPTPITDKRKASFALDTIRQLEAELTAAREEIKELNDKLDDAVADATNAVNDIIRMKWQRDRLADLVKQFIYILDITEESDGGRLFHPTNITSCRAGDLRKIGELVEALRRASRNQPTEP